MCRIPPPPPARLSTLVALRKKSVGVSPTPTPPPPPRSSAFLGLAQLSMLAAVRKVCCAHLFKILDPPLAELSKLSDQIQFQMKTLSKSD